MPASEAQMAANRKNAQKSTGPKTPEGKEASRANSYKHGMTATKVLPEREADEVLRRLGSYVTELNPSGEVGYFLCRLAAMMSARVERCQLHETASQAERIRKAIAEIEYPEGIDALGAAKLREEVSQRAVFDPSPEAILARKYAAAAERSFYRALKELRVIERQAKKLEAELFGEELGSNLPGDMTDDEFDELEARATAPQRREPAKSTSSAEWEALRKRPDVPIAVGRRR